MAVAEARPEAQPGADGEPPRLRVLRRPHGGKGAAVRAGILAATSDLVVFADSDMATPPDQLPLLTEALARPRRGARQPGPTRRHRPTVEPALPSTRARQGLPRPGRCMGHRLGARLAVRVQGLPTGGGPGPVRPPADHQHRVRCGDHLPRSQAWLPGCRGAGPVDRPAWLADACPAGLAVRVAWDLVRIPLIHRHVERSRTVEPVMSAGSGSD